MTNRKFYKTVISITVLSEDKPYNYGCLNQLDYDITYGDCSGISDITSCVELNGQEVAKELLDQCSDPEFFQLDDDGNDLKDDDTPAGFCPACSMPGPADESCPSCPGFYYEP